MRSVTNITNIRRHDLLPKAAHHGVHIGCLFSVQKVCWVGEYISGCFFMGTNLFRFVGLGHEVEKLDSRSLHLRLLLLPGPVLGGMFHWVLMSCFLIFITFCFLPPRLKSAQRLRRRWTSVTFGSRRRRTREWSHASLARFFPLLSWGAARKASIWVHGFSE